MSLIGRSTVIDMLVAAQGEAFREWYESDDEYARAAVDRALAVVPSADSSGAVDALYEAVALLDALVDADDLPVDVGDRLDGVRRASRRLGGQ
jgi:hypothetical protein